MVTRPALCVAVLLLALAGCSKKKGDEAPNDSAKSTEPTADPTASGGTATDPPAESTPVRIAGAANLVKVMEQIVPRFEKESGAKVDFIAGSSGKLAAQLKEGAPFDLFMSANVKFVDEATSSGECLADSKKLYARGHLVMWSKEGAKDEPPAEPAGLTDKKYETIAVAQPEQAPYGAAARAALEKLGVWTKIEKRVIFGSSLEETIKLVESGNAEVGLLALSQVIKAKGKYVEIPDDLHDPLDQALAVCKNGKQQALAGKFVEFLGTPEIQELMKSYGYTMP